MMVAGDLVPNWHRAIDNRHADCELIVTRIISPKADRRMKQESASVIIWLQTLTHGL